MLESHDKRKYQTGGYPKITARLVRKERKFILTGQSKPGQPVSHIIIGLRGAAIPEGQALQHLSIWFGVLNGIERVGKSAAARGYERNDTFSAQIISVQKAIDCHRQISPPGRRPQEYSVVLVQIINLGDQFRTDTGTLFCLAHVYGVIAG